MSSYLLQVRHKLAGRDTDGKKTHDERKKQESETDIVLNLGSVQAVGEMLKAAA